jgi:hypothetical protein
MAKSTGKRGTPKDRSLAKKPEESSPKDGSETTAPASPNFDVAAFNAGMRQLKAAMAGGPSFAVVDGRGVVLDIAPTEEAAQAAVLRISDARNAKQKRRSEVPPRTPVQRRSGPSPRVTTGPDRRAPRGSTKTSTVAPARLGESDDLDDAARARVNAELASLGPFRWHKAWLDAENFLPPWREGQAERTTPGAIGVFLEANSGEAMLGMHWFRDLPEACEALVLALPLIFGWADNSSLEERLGLYGQARRSVPTDLEADEVWQRIATLVSETAQSNLIAVGRSEDFVAAPNPPFAAVRRSYRIARDGEADDAPVSPKERDDFWEWVENIEG